MANSYSNLTQEYLLQKYKYNPETGVVTTKYTRKIVGWNHEGYLAVNKNGKKLKDLPSGAIIGTSSKKRKEAILKYRPDLVIRDIRGNIDERLVQLDKGGFDAIIVAHAALVRLGLENRTTEIISKDIVEPHPYQGRLAVQARKDRKDIIKIFRRLNDA